MMTRGRESDAPPRIAEALLALAIDSPVARDGLVGDLREAYADRRHTRSRLGCQVWYWHEALSASARYVRARVVTSFSTRQPRSVFAEHHQHEPPSHMRNFANDVRYALRVLGKAPALTAISIMALTLGTAMPTMMFTIVNGVFRDLPVEQPDRVVRLFTIDGRPDGDGVQFAIRHHDLADWRAQQRSFEGLAGFVSEDVTLSGGDARPDRQDAAFVTPNAFEVLRVQPALGRSFAESDASPASPAVAIISHGMWQTRFGGDSAVTRRTIAVDGVQRSIVGVTQPGFGFPGNEAVWLPLALAVSGPRDDADEVQVFGRLREGVSLTQANVELAAMAARLALAHPATNDRVSAGARRYGEGLVDPSFARGLLTMLGAVSFVLLIACINVAHLSVARAVHRSREVAVRSALGASRPRIAAQFFIESLIVAGAGGMLGTALAMVGVGMVENLIVSTIGLSWVNFAFDLRVLAFVLGAVVLSGLVAGVTPAVLAARVPISAALNSAQRGGIGSGRGVARFGRGLVIAEIAASCALLAVSGLLIKGVRKLDAIDLGIPAGQIVTGEVEVPRETYPALEDRVRFFEELERTVAGIPGVTHAAVMSDIPATIGFRWPLTIEGSDEPTAPVAILTASPGFLKLLDAQVVDGRAFTASDRAGGEPAMMVNNAFAERYFPNRRAVGRTVKVGNTVRTIVGVAPDLLMGAMDQPGVNGAGAYLPFAQQGNVSMQLMVRTTGDPVAFTPLLRDALASIDPTVALMDVGRVDQLIANETALFAVFGRLFLFFGIVALFLAAMGLYGVVAFTMEQRTREWGIRMALGATRRSVTTSAIRQASVHLAIGLATGLVIAGALSQPLSSFFYQVEPWDLSVFAAIGAILVTTSLVATLVPVQRAAGLDPMEALRQG